MESNTAGQTGKTPARVTERATIATSADVVIAQTRSVDLTAAAEPSEADSIEAGDRCERDGEIVTVERVTGTGAYVIDRNGMRWLVNLCTLTKRPDVSEADVLAARYPLRDAQGFVRAYFVISPRGRRGPYASYEAAAAWPRFPEERIEDRRILGRNGRAVRDPHARPQNH